MRNTDERLAAVKRRERELEQEHRRRKGLWIAAVSVATCLLLIGGAALAMPGWSERLAAAPPAGPGLAASMFSGGGQLGYLVIGILAFLLGAAVTILCFRLRMQDKNKEPAP